MKEPAVRQRTFTRNAEMIMKRNTSVKPLMLAVVTLVMMTGSLSLAQDTGGFLRTEFEGFSPLKAALLSMLGIPIRGVATG